jgi:hypothetical protein
MNLCKSPAPPNPRKSPGVVSPTTGAQRKLAAGEPDRVWLSRQFRPKSDASPLEFALGRISPQAADGLNAQLGFRINWGAGEKAAHV